MRRALILATLTLLLMAVAGITVAQEKGFGPEGRLQTEPGSQEATISEATGEPTEFVDEESVEGDEPARGDVIENPDESEADNSEITEDKAAKGERKKEDRGKPPSVGNPGRSEELGKPEGGDRPEARGKPTSKPVGVGKGEKARRPAGTTKARGQSEQTRGGGGRQKITLCHKGKHTITVGAPAKDAHLRHGDSLGECGL